MAMGSRRAHLRLQENLAAMKAPAYMLTDPQWARLFDLYMGVMIVVMHYRTMRVLERKGLTKRRSECSRWEITEAGRSALRTSAPTWALIQ